MFLLHEAHRLAQELQDLEPLGRRDVAGIQLIELSEETNVGRADVDEWQRLQPLRAAGRIREIGSGARLDARGIEARHGSIQSAPQRGRKRAAVRSRAPRDVRARRLGPDWAGKMAIALMARNHVPMRSEEHTSELQSRLHLVCRLLLEKKKTNTT